MIIRAEVGQYPNTKLHVTTARVDWVTDASLTPAGLPMRFFRRSFCGSQLFRNTVQLCWPRLQLWPYVN